MPYPLVLEFLAIDVAREQLAWALCDAMRREKASFLAFRCAMKSYFEAFRQSGGGIYEAGDPGYEIPSLYQPVVPKYRPLLWGYRMATGMETLQPSEFYITRSDGDRDRPSRINSERL